MWSPENIPRPLCPIHVSFYSQWSLDSPWEWISTENNGLNGVWWWRLLSSHTHTQGRDTHTHTHTRERETYIHTRKKDTHKGERHIHMHTQERDIQINKRETQTHTHAWKTDSQSDRQTDRKTERQTPRKGTHSFSRWFLEVSMEPVLAVRDWGTSTPGPGYKERKDSFHS